MKKYDNTQKIKVTADFGSAYKKGESHYVEKGLLKSLKSRGLKCEEISVNFKKLEDDARRANEKSRAKQIRGAA